jgi:hypothetical protein
MASSGRNIAGWAGKSESRGVFSQTFNSVDVESYIQHGADNLPPRMSGSSWAEDGFLNKVPDSCHFLGYFSIKTNQNWTRIGRAKLTECVQGLGTRASQCLSSFNVSGSWGSGVLGAEDLLEITPPHPTKASSSWMFYIKASIIIYSLSP